MQNITQRYLPLLLIVIFAAFIRFNKLAVNPPALFADEVDIGYQVKSFLSTGRDYYGNFFSPLNLGYFFPRQPIIGCFRSLQKQKFIPSRIVGIPLSGSNPLA